MHDEQQPDAPGEQVDPAQRSSHSPDEAVVDEGIDTGQTHTSEPDPAIGESIEESPAEGFDADAPSGT
ncbi:hypothetical protein [Agrococcus sp. TF02-05]|uniref:hypothetical protein n=1 Tax=Agrococcus sp. TF02-05 TaxID=2815211 RepID=UPI001AA16375|nr:hypothetical protein [Agrococcus sp. TF02-05]MBO1770845.1 hypothetical protein [Agrococcus sp. TF02-05]